MICADAISIAAEHVVQRIRQPGDDMDALREAARAWVLAQVEEGSFVLR